MNVKPRKSGRPPQNPLIAKSKPLLVRFSSTDYEIISALALRWHRSKSEIVRILLSNTLLALSDIAEEVGEISPWRTPDEVLASDFLAMAHKSMASIEDVVIPDRDTGACDA